MTLVPTQARATRSPILQVLRDRPALRKIRAFMPGLPNLIQQFLCDTEKEFNGDTTGAFSKRVGRCVHIAIAVNNEQVLEMLYYLHKQPENKSEPRLFFWQVMLCAATFGHLNILKWLYARTPSRPEWEYEPGLVRAALQHRDLDLLSWLYDYCPPIPPR